MRPFFISNLLLAGLVTLVGCSSPSLKVRSQPPGAEVWAKRGDSAPVKLGVTPLTLDRESGFDWSGGGFELDVDKDGYSSEALLIPRSALGAAVSLDVALKDSKLPAACSQMDQIVNEVSRGVARTQFEIFRKDFDKAREIALALSNKYPNVATLQTLLGNIYYLEKDYSEALASYKRASGLDPEDPETGRMINKLSNVAGAPRPAADGGQ